MRTRLLMTMVAVVTATCLVGCTSAAADGSTTGPTSAASSSAASPAASASPTDTTAADASTAAPGSRKVSRAGVITTGLRSPWGLAFLPDGSALVTERDTGRIRRVPADGGKPTIVGKVRGVVPSGSGGEGGLLGIAVPTGGEPDYLFVYYTAASDNRVARIAWDGTRLGAQTPIVTGVPKAFYHNGGRLLVVDDTLFISTGDATQESNAQTRKSLGGKVLRVTFDGDPAPGNPFDGSPIYTMGHRNIQGLAVDSQGRVWASEFGNHDVDELNLLAPGGNYGWPICEGACGKDGYTDPFAHWSPTSIASPSGLAIVDDIAYVASLRGERLWRVPLTGRNAGTTSRVAVGDLGRLRTIAQAPDGSLWLVTSNTDGRGSPRANDDRIIRLTVG